MKNNTLHINMLVQTVFLKKNEIKQKPYLLKKNQQFLLSLSSF